MYGDLAFLTRVSRETRVGLGGILDSYLKTDQLQDYRAYPKQLEFHAAGRRYTHRLLMAGNQTGKSHSCGAEFAFHLTGEYPESWTGLRYEHPITAWASSETAESTRDNPQRVLLGLPKELGTGLIPKRCITALIGRAKGVADAYDFLRIRHVSGGLSMLKFRNYAQDRKSWQGPPVHLVWFDEEPPFDIYGEGLARTMAVNGKTIMSFTPLMGHTEIIQKYLDAAADLGPDEMPSGDIYVVRMTIEDAMHYTPEERARRIANTAKHERGARIRGEPMLGRGRIFPYDEDEVVIKPFTIPDHWPVLGGLDFGGMGDSAHPVGAAKIAWDMDNDVIYIVKDHRRKSVTPAVHWLTLRRWGKQLKWAWPKDGMKHVGETGTGLTMIDLYKEEGMKALADPAHFPPRRTGQGKSTSSGVGTQGVYSVEKGVLEMQDRFETGGLKIFETCELFIDEFRMYHRDDDGKIVKLRDDVIDAVRYAIMMKRFAAPDRKRRRKPRDDPDWQVGF